MSKINDLNIIIFINENETTIMFYCLKGICLGLSGNAVHLVHLRESHTLLYTIFTSWSWITFLQFLWSWLLCVSKFIIWHLSIVVLAWTRCICSLHLGSLGFSYTYIKYELLCTARPNSYIALIWIIASWSRSFLNLLPLFVVGNCNSTFIVEHRFIGSRSWSLSFYHISSFTGAYLWSIKLFSLVIWVISSRSRHTYLLRCASLSFSYFCSRFWSFSKSVISSGSWIADVIS